MDRTINDDDEKESPESFTDQRETESDSAPDVVMDRQETDNERVQTQSDDDAFKIEEYPTPQDESNHADTDNKDTIDDHAEAESGPCNSKEPAEEEWSEDSDQNATNDGLRQSDLSGESVAKEDSASINNPIENEENFTKSPSDTKIQTPNPATNPVVPAKPPNQSINNPKPPEPEKKIKVHFVAVGSAPILKKSKFLMSSSDQFAVAIAFVRKLLKLSSSVSAGTVSSSSLFLYVNSAFVPSPDERIGDLFDCFGIRGELVIHYSLQEAWG